MLHGSDRKERRARRSRDDLQVPIADIGVTIRLPLRRGRAALAAHCKAERFHGLQVHMAFRVLWKGVSYSYRRPCPIVVEGLADETSPPKFSASRRERGRAAGHVARRLGTN